MALSGDLKDCPILLSLPSSEGNAGEIRLTIGTKSSSSGRKRRRMLVGHSDALDLAYSANDFSGSSALKKNACKYAIGILDEKSDSITLIPTDHVFVMKPDFANKGGDYVESSSTIANYERKQGLTEAFGTQKKKKAVKANAAKIVSSDNIVGVDAVQSAITSSISEMLASDEMMGGFDAGGEALAEHRKRMLPKFDMMTQDPKLVYPIEGVIPEHTREALGLFYERTQTQIAELGASWEQAFSVGCNSNLVKHINSQIKEEDGSDKAEKKARKKRCQLMVLNGMVCAVQLCLNPPAASTDGNSNKPTQEYVLETLDKCVPLPVREYIRTFLTRSKFKNVGQFHLTKTQADRALLHMIVLGLHLSKFQLDLGMLATDLKLTVKRLSDVAREAGCKIVKGVMEGSDKESSYATLVAPLKFPPPKRIPGKSK